MNDHKESINAAVAEHIEGWTWVPTGYTSDNPPRPRWLTLIGKHTNPPHGWVFFPDGPAAPSPCNRHWICVPDYLNDANEVVRLLANFQWNAESIPVSGEPPNYVHTIVRILEGPGVFEAYGDNFRRAACLCMLKARGVKIDH